MHHFWNDNAVPSLAILLEPINTVCECSFLICLFSYFMFFHLWCLCSQSRGLFNNKETKSSKGESDADASRVFRNNLKTQSLLNSVFIFKVLSTSFSYLAITWNSVCKLTLQRERERERRKIVLSRRVKIWLIWVFVCFLFVVQLGLLFLSLRVNCFGMLHHTWNFIRKKWEGV